MPFIHIRSLHFEKSLDASKVIKEITEDFSIATGVAIEHITVTWEFVTPGHYAVAGKVVEYQSMESHPLLVDLLIPDFNSAQEIEDMVRETAKSISRRVKIPVDNIFVHGHVARSGRVFDAGEIVHW